MRATAGGRLAGLAYVVVMVIGDAGDPAIFGPIGHGGAERINRLPGDGLAPGDRRVPDGLRPCRGARALIALRGFGMHPVPVTTKRDVHTAVSRPG